MKSQVHTPVPIFEIQIHVFYMHLICISTSLAAHLYNFPLKFSRKIVTLTHVFPDIVKAPE